MREIEDILEKASALAEQAKSTCVYEAYYLAGRELEQYPELQVQVDAFRKERYLAYEAIGEPISFAELAYLEEKEAALCVHPAAVRYLKAETAWCRLLQELQETLSIL